MASRSKRFLSGLLTGYGNIAANIVFTMASVPLALLYLDKERFGIWALALQINGYLYLLDLGMNGAVARFAADYKDEVNGGDYGSNLLTGGLVFLVQGLIIAVVGMIFSWFAPSLFSIPEHLAGEFRTILLILSGTAGSSVALRIIGAPLWAFQRSDVVNGCASFSQILNLALLWLGFHANWGLKSFALAPLPSLLASWAIYYSVCRRNGFYPNAGHWGQPSLSLFKRVFGYGKDTVMINLGAQMINATQILIATRWISLEAAATFSVATKFYTLALQLVINPVSASASGLTELHVRGEYQRFVRRYWDLIALVLVVSTVAASCLAVGNRSLITVWTGSSITWSWQGDVLLGLLVVLRSLNGCFVGLFGLVKNWKPVRFVYFAEGLTFIPLAIVGSIYLGINGILLASLVAHLTVTTTFAGRAATAILGVGSHALRSLGASAAMVSLAALAGWFAEKADFRPWWVLMMTPLIAAVVVAGSWHFILPSTMKEEAMNRLAGVSRRFKQLLGHAG